MGTDGWELSLTSKDLALKSQKVMVSLKLE